MKIGIAIITKNRRNIVLRALDQHRRFSTYDELVIIDDHGDFPLNISTRSNERIYYSDTWLGVAGARNKGLELLEDCDYTFIMDDDIFPKAPGWTDRYVLASKYCEDRQIFLAVPAPWGTPVEYYGGFNSMNKSTATLILFTKQMRQELGGFDITLGKYGHEDTDLFYRASNAGFTKYGNFCTIADCEKYLHLCDIHGDFENLKWPHASALGDAKYPLIEESREAFLRQLNSGNAIYKPYK